MVSVCSSPGNSPDRWAFPWEHSKKLEVTYSLKDPRINNARLLNALVLTALVSQKPLLMVNVTLMQLTLKNHP